METPVRNPEVYNPEVNSTVTTEDTRTSFIQTQHILTILFKEYTLENNVRRIELACIYSKLSKPMQSYPTTDSKELIKKLQNDFSIYIPKVSN